MKIKIPGRGQVQIYGDGMYVEVPGDSIIEVFEPGGETLPDTVWVSSAGGDTWVSSAGGDYWVSTV